MQSDTQDGLGRERAGNRFYFEATLARVLCDALSLSRLPDSFEVSYPSKAGEDFFNEEYISIYITASEEGHRYIWDALSQWFEEKNEQIANEHFSRGGLWLPMLADAEVAGQIASTRGGLQREYRMMFGKDPVHGSLGEGVLTGEAGEPCPREYSLFVKFIADEAMKRENPEPELSPDERVAGNAFTNNSLIDFINDELFR